MVLMAALWSMDWMCSVTTMLSSRSRKSASIRSVSSGASSCRKDTPPQVCPILKYFPSRKVKLSGAMKSLLESPVCQMASQANWNFLSPAGWSMPCSTARRS